MAVLRDCNKKNALEIAEKIRRGEESIDNYLYTTISISLGVSSYPEDGNKYAIRSMIAVAAKIFLTTISIFAKTIE